MSLSFLLKKPVWKAISITEQKKDFEGREDKASTFIENTNKYTKTILKSPLLFFVFIVGISVFSVFISYYLSPQFKEFKYLNTEILKANNKLSNIEYRMTLAADQKLLEHWSTLSSPKVFSLKHLPENLISTQNSLQLSKNFKIHNINLPAPVTTTIKHLDLTVIRQDINISLSGSYPEIMKFISALENNYPVKINSLKITDKNNLKCTLKLSGFFTSNKDFR